MAAFKMKTAAGLLLVIIACLVVSMLGYHAYTEGLTAREKREKKAGDKKKTSSKTVKKNDSKAVELDKSFTPSTPTGEIVEYGYQ